MKYNPYSISKLGSFNSCPAKFKMTYIDKIKIDKPRELALQKGGYIHELLEHNFDYSIDVKLDDIFTEKEKQKAIDIVKEFENSEMGIKYKKIIPIATLEEDFGLKIVDSKLVLCGFWDKEAFIRGSADLYFTRNDTGYIWDYKSGKDKSDDETFGIQQAKAYGIMMFTKFPEIQKVKAIFCFVEHSTEKSIEFKRKDLQSYIKDFYIDVKVVENTEIFKTSVSALCDYCDFKKYGYCDAPDKLFEDTNSFMNTKITF